jgi:Family of unknown function (DUF6527)
MGFSGWMRQLLVWMRRIRQPDFVVRRVRVHPAPEEIKPGMMIVVADRHLQKWACFQCPGGCGEVIKLSLNPKQRPCWQVQADDWGRPTVSPSVRQLNACGCHFWIREGNVEWCDD